MRRRSILPLLLVLAASVSASVPAAALEYEIRLANGNVFTTRYEPVIAPFDDTRLLFMTSLGNTVSLRRADVAEVISLTEASGFGKRLDDMTILIGLAPNYNPTPEEEAALAAQGGLPGQAPQVYTSPLISEPDQTGGIPLQFLNYTTPPLGGGAAGGGAADLRRGAGGSQFVEPQTSDQ